MGEGKKSVWGFSTYTLRGSEEENDLSIFVFFPLGLHPSSSAQFIMWKTLLPPQPPVSNLWLYC